MTHIYIIHENDQWTEPLRKQLEARNLPYKEWHLDQGHFDLTKEPPNGVFYNRMSASSHTRDHRFAAEYTGAVLAWLQQHGRTVFNTGRALQLEVSKVAQYTALQAHNILTPHTIAAVGKEHIIEAAQSFNKPFITKHNRGGKGLGVQLFTNAASLEAYVNSAAYEEPIDGITLLQEYIESAEPYITRCEFIGGKFLYAVRVDTSDGFQLCPADACQIGDAFCPTTKQPAPKFQIIENFQNPIIEKYEAFLKANEITFAGIEFITDKEGAIYTYDVNTNTNYNADAERAAGLSAMGAMAEFLGSALKQLAVTK
jgi:hypothetical protein